MANENNNVGICEDWNSQPNIANNYVIMNTIFGNLEAGDLLNCRLVCHFWDTECLRRLRKSWVLRMGFSDFTKYVRFLVRSTTLAQLAMPLHLYGRSSFRTLGTDVDSIVNLFGRNCIVGFWPQWDWWLWHAKMNIIDILVKISPGLISTSLEYYKCADVVRLDSKEISFPKLKTICLSLYSHRGRKTEKSISKACSRLLHLIQVCPHLEDLEIQGQLPSGILLIKKLKHLNVHIHKQYNMFQHLLKEIQLARPTLEKFSYRFSDLAEGDPAPTRAMFLILRELTKTIKSLQITLPRGEFFRSSELNFPKLPSLKYLRIDNGLHFPHNSTPFDPAKYNMTCSNLPVLQKLRIPLNLCWPVVSNGSTRYPLVTELVLDVYACPDIGWPRSNQDAQAVMSNVNNILANFPNALKISLKNASTDLRSISSYGRYIKTVIKAIIVEPSSHARKIQELSINDYREDHLGEALIELGVILQMTSASISAYIANLFYPIHLIQDLRKICVKQVNNASTGGRDSCYRGRGLREHRQYSLPSCPYLKLTVSHLVSWAKCFPNLCRFQLPRLISQSDSSVQGEIINEISEKFPQWKVDLV